MLEATVTAWSVAVSPVLGLAGTWLCLRSQARRDREHHEHVAGLARAATAVVVVVAPAQDD